MCSGKKIYLDDFNVWMDQQNSVDANKFRSVLNNFGLKNHVNKATHNLGHTLDLIIDCVENSIVGSVYVEPQNTISDHMVVNFKKFVDTIAKNKTVINFCNYISIGVIDLSSHF